MSVILIKKKVGAMMGHSWSLFQSATLAEIWVEIVPIPKRVIDRQSVGSRGNFRGKR